MNRARGRKASSTFRLIEKKLKAVLKNQKKMFADAHTFVTSALTTAPVMATP